MKRLLCLPLLALVFACDHGAAIPPPAQPSKVDALVAAHDYPAAIALLEERRLSVGEDPTLVRQLVELYRVQGDSARAIQRARAGIEAHPDAKALYVPLAKLYLQVNQYDQAKPLLLEARRLGADEAEVAVTLGSLLARTGDTVGARAEFERARTAGAEERIVQYNLGLLFVQEHELDKARAAFETLLTKSPDFAAGKRELARVLLDQVTIQGKDSTTVDRAQIDRAMDMLWSIKDQLKDDWRVQEAMGDGWLLVGDFEASVAAYTEALKLGQNPKSVEDRYRVAKQKQKDAATKAAQATPPADPK